MSLSLQDAQAIASTAQRLRVDPRALGALMEMESGLDPNIWGGAGGQYRGLIQFGPRASKEVGLPNKPMSIAEQMPFVERYFQQRGFTPGKHGTTELYRTVLVGNPRQSGTDSFGTNSDRAAERMKPGGDLYQRFAGKFDPVASKLGSESLPPAASAGAPAGGGNPGSDLARQTMGGSSEDALGALGLGSLKVPGLEDLGGGLPGGQRMAALTAAVAPLLAMADPTTGRLAGQQIQGLLEQKAADDLILGAHRGLAQKLMPEATPLPALSSGSAGDGIQDLFSGGGAEDSPGRPAGRQSVAAGGPELGIVDIGKRLQGAGLRVREHPSFGGVGGHSQGSLHYKGLALDLTDWQDPGESDKSWKPRKAFLGQRFQEILGDQAEIFHPGNDPKGHGTHIHFGLPTGKLGESQVSALVQARQEALKRYPLRWAG